jgi:hypothetical protein
LEAFEQGYLCFRDEHGWFRLNCLIDLERLGEEFSQICERLEVGTNALGRIISSLSVLKRIDLTSTQIDKVKVRYRDDFDLIRDRLRVL